MKKLLSAAALSALSLTAHADGCVVFYELGGLIMESRQYETRTSDEMKTNIIDRVNVSDDIKNSLYGLVDLAFKVPRFYREEMRQEAVARYAEDLYWECENQLLNR